VPAPPGAPQNIPPVNPVTPLVLLGLWRGVEIDNHYVTNEFDFNFKNDNTVDAYVNSRLLWLRRVGSSAGGWVVLNITAGNNAGHFVTGSYTISISSMVDALTLGVGELDNPWPPTFSEAMQSSTMSVYSLWKCMDPVCIFVVPSQQWQQGQQGGGGGGVIDRVRNWARWLLPF
jgi:hypothetical protein